MRGDSVKPLKEKISITIDSDLLELVREEAENDDRSVSQFINLVLKKYITEKRQKEKPGPAGHGFFVKNFPIGRQEGVDRSRPLCYNITKLLHR